MIPDRGQGRSAFAAPYPLLLNSLGTTPNQSEGLRGLFAVTSQSLLADCEQVPGPERELTIIRGTTCSEGRTGGRRYIVDQRKTGESAPACTISIVMAQAGVSLGGLELHLSFFLMAHEALVAKAKVTGRCTLSKA